MKNILLIITALFTLFSLNHSFKQTLVEKEEPVVIEAKTLDNRAAILNAYLAKFNSPMQNHAQDFIDASDTYGLDWKMLPSIAGVESTFGKYIPGGYNAYGWAIYNSSSRFGFKSWRDGMFIVAKGLKEGYVNKGLTDPYSMNKIYAASPHWGRNVTFFMTELENFARSHKTNDESIAKASGMPNIAAVSGQLALKN